MTSLSILSAALTGFLAGPVMADVQTYSILLGHRVLGSLVFEGQGSDETLLLTLDHTPFGLEDGTFKATTQTLDETTYYLGESRGSETRDIAITRKANVVKSVTITPQSEMTELSEPGRVPAGVLTPTEFLAALQDAGTCPSSLAVYDGRRVAQITAISSKLDGDLLTCDLSYRVVMGPGYMSPFHFKSFGMQLAYKGRNLDSLVMNGGGFEVSLIH